VVSTYNQWFILNCLLLKNGYFWNVIQTNYCNVFKEAFYDNPEQIIIEKQKIPYQKANKSVYNHYFFKILIK
jgi:hypothetical protein